MISLDLYNVVEAAVESLRLAYDEFNQHKPTHAMFVQWNGCVEAKVKLIASLENSKNILKRRENHAKEIQVAFDESEPLNAFLHMKAYQVDAWSAYDRLYDVYTRIVGSSAITMNRVPKANVKMEELFKGKGEKLRFGTVFGNDALMIENFRWSYLVSYKVRNVIVHDGGYLFEKPLFEFDPARGSLVLSSDVETMFNPEPDSEKIAEAKLSSSRKNDPKFPWYDLSALDALQKYNSDLDIVIGMLLHQAAVNFESQVKYVCSIV